MYVTSISYSAGGTKDVRVWNRATYDNGIGSYIGPAGSPGGFFMPYSEVVLNNSAYNKTLELPTKLPSKTDIMASAIAYGVDPATPVEVVLRGWLE